MLFNKNVTFKSHKNLINNIFILHLYDHGYIIEYETTFKIILMAKLNEKYIRIY